MNAPLGRRALAEAVGTAALVAVVVGSGIQATEPTDDVGVQLPANSLATVFGPGVPVVLFGPVSGAYFNPARDARGPARRPPYARRADPRVPEGAGRVPRVSRTANPNSPRPDRP